MQQTFGHPSAGPGCLVESKRQETHSKRLFVARLKGQSAWARIYSIKVYMMKLVIGFTQETKRKETTEEVSNPLLVYINLLALLYVLHA